MTNQTPKGQGLPLRVRGLSFLSRSSHSFLLSTLSLLLWVPAGNAADKIFLKKGGFIRSVQVSSLETFAETGTVSEDLAFLFRAVGADDLEQANYRATLQDVAPVDGILLSRFFNTAIGEDILTEVGRIIQTRSGNNGGIALRAGLTLAALDVEGLSLITFFRNLPVDMQIDLDRAEALSQSIDRLLQTQTQTIDTLALLSTEESAEESAIDYGQWSDLSQPGPYGIKSQRRVFTDPSRDRTFYVDIHQPQRWRPGRAPVVLISHGLGDSPESFTRHARVQHLASHGYVVVVPQHPGSDATHLDNFRRGLARELFLVNEFIDRPKDISYVLDELERLNSPEFEGRLNLEAVGVSGHSFGGYTALAVAGATIDFDHLEQTCNRPFFILNMSLLLQCQALTLPLQDYDFRDHRVAAVAALNPVNSGIFGPEGLGKVDVPVLIAAGSHDPATPAVFEQFQTFPWFTTENRILGLLEGQAHVDIAELDGGLSQLINAIPDLTVASSETIEYYLRALGLAYFERFIARKTDYRLYLRSSYAAYLSQDQQFKLYTISAISDEALVAPLEEQPLLP
jgi:predicted dienelactone hydrolase